MVANQVTDYLQSNNVMPERKLAYRRHHSTETALLRVVSDIMTAADSGLVTLLGLLYLSFGVRYCRYQYSSSTAAQHIRHHRINIVLD